MKRIASLSAVHRVVALAAGLVGAIVLLLATPAAAQAGLCDWVGSASNNWESTSNWGGDCGFGNLPGLGDDVRIPASATRFPTLSTSQSFRGMRIEAGAVMTITASGEATLSGDSAVTGTIRSLPGSRLTLSPGVSSSLARFASSQVIQGELRLGGAGLGTGTLILEGANRLTISDTGSLVLGAGFAGGSDWDFQGQLDNRGLMSLAKDLTINAPGAVHTSTGEIRIAAGASLAFLGGPTQRVTLGGSVVLTANTNTSAPAELIVDGGTFIHQGGTLTGTGAMALRNGVTGTLTGDMVNRLGELSVRNSSLSGAAKLDNRGLLTLDQSVIGAELSNAGLVASRLTNTLSGKVTTFPGSTLQLLPKTANEPVWLQVDQGLENGGTLDLSSASGTSNWRWYVSSPVLTNTPTGQINVALSSAKAVFSGRLLNQGAFNVDGATILTTTNAVHTSTGSITLQGGYLDATHGDLVNLGSLSFSGVSLPGALEAAGMPNQPSGGIWMGSRTVTNGPGGSINAGTGVLSVDAPTPMSINRYWLEGELRNQGALNVGAQLTVTWPGAVHTSTGSINLSRGALNFGERFNNQGSLTFSSTTGATELGVSCAGPSAQPCRFENAAAGTVSVNGPAILKAELNNAGLITINDTLTLTKPGKTHTNTGTITLLQKFAEYEEFTNYGTINLGPAALSYAKPSQVQLYYSTFRSPLTNGPGGVIVANGPSMLEAELLNNGTLNVDASLTISRVGKTHVNSGTINLNNDFEILGEFSNNGVINFNSTITPTGALQPRARGSAIWIHADALNNTPSGTLNVLATATGGAHIEAALINQGTLNVNAPLTLTKPGAVHTNTGVIEINDGYLSTPEHFINAGVLNLNGLAAATGALQPRSRGHAIWIQSSALNNAPSGTLNVLATPISATLTARPQAGSAMIQAQLNNQGTLNISGSLEVSATGLIHQNTGVINVLTDASFAQPLTNAGTVSVTGASLSVAGVYTQTGGLMALNGTLSAPETRLQGGVLRGTGALKGNLTNGALVAPGNSPGALSVSGDYTQLPSGSLNIELGGTVPGSQYDTLTVSGAASLSGTLNVSLVNAFAPANGNTFTFLNAATRSGAFGIVTGAALDGGKRLAPVYGPDYARLLMQGRATFLPGLMRH